MASTTLVTFLYQAPRYISQVELLGSWDNFTKSYPMQRDKSVSSTHWKGCHSFSNIVCDGDLFAMDGSTRHGGLQMGGTYWYYYRLDGDIECHDLTIESTRGCPFLPGQEVNVLEVPVQEELETSFSNSSAINVFTLDPSAKFISPRPSPTTETFIEEAAASPVRSALQRASSLKHSFLSTLPKFSLARTRSLPNKRCRTAVSSASLEFLESSRPFTSSIAAGLKETWSNLVDSLDDSASIRSIHSSALHEKLVMPNGLRCHPPQDVQTAGLDDLDLDNSSSIFSDQTPTATLSINGGRDGTENVEMPVDPSSYSLSTSSRTSGVFSLLSDSAFGSVTATNHHSIYLAQPQTPSLDFDEFILEPLKFDMPLSEVEQVEDSTLQSTQNHFEPYLQPERECVSTITLRESGVQLKDLNHTATLSAFEKLDLVESWRNGESPSSVPPPEPTALQELINDLGYLSSMIH